MILVPARRPAPWVAVVLLPAGPAGAHELVDDASLMAAALHPLGAVSHLVLLLALGLLAGRLPRRRLRPGLSALAGGLLAGLAATVTGGASLLPGGVAAAAILALALAAGLALALEVRPTGDAVAVLALLAGLLVGLDSHLRVGKVLAQALGTFLGVVLIVAAGAALSAWAQGRPVAVARRVAGSWIAAVALMLLALAASGRAA